MGNWILEPPTKAWCKPDSTVYANSISVEAANIMMDEESRLHANRKILMEKNSNLTAGKNIPVHTTELFLDHTTDVRGKGGGFPPCQGNGAPHSPFRDGSYGGIGSTENVSFFIEDEVRAFPHGDVREPSCPGSGGGMADCSEGDGGSGGASVELIVHGLAYVGGTVDVSGSDALRSK